MKLDYSQHNGALPEKKPVPPHERHIPAGNCCSRCVYNIPQGVLMLVLPGLGILVIGTVIMSWTSTDTSWHDGVTQAGMILVILGGVLFLGGIIYWIYQWCKITPNTPKKSTISPTQFTEPVSLVGVYKLRHEGIPNNAFDYDDPGPSISTISRQY